MADEKVIKKLAEEQKKYDNALSHLDKISQEMFSQDVAASKGKTRVSTSLVQEVLTKRKEEREKKAQETFSLELNTLVDSKIALDKEIEQAQEAFDKAKLEAIEKFNQQANRVQGMLERIQEENRKDDEAVNAIA